MSDTIPHSDLRAPDLDFKRSRDHISKWKYGWTAQNSGAKCGHAYGCSWEPQPDKDEREGRNIVPRVMASNKGKLPGWPASGAILSRLASQHHARLDARDLDVEVDIPTLPADVEVPADADVLYSYDRDSSPSSALGLGELVDKAERVFNDKETERIVRGYEVLDERGERVVRTRRGRRTGGSPETGPEEEEGDGEWEAI